MNNTKNEAICQDHLMMESPEVQEALIWPKEKELHIVAQRLANKLPQTGLDLTLPHV